MQSACRRRPGEGPSRWAGRGSDGAFTPCAVSLRKWGVRNRLAATTRGACHPPLKSPWKFAEAEIRFRRCFAFGLTPIPYRWARFRRRQLKPGLAGRSARHKASPGAQSRWRVFRSRMSELGFRNQHTGIGHASSVARRRTPCANTAAFGDSPKSSLSVIEVRNRIGARGVAVFRAPGRPSAGSTSG